MAARSLKIAARSRTRSCSHSSNPSDQGLVEIRTMGLKDLGQGHTQAYQAQQVQLGLCLCNCSRTLSSPCQVPAQVALWI